MTDEHSVLGVLGAWQEHRESAKDGAVLVVTTGVPDDRLGWDLRGHALLRATLTVDRAEIVAQRFGATEVDPRIRKEPWLLEALLDRTPDNNRRDEIYSIDQGHSTNTINIIITNNLTGARAGEVRDELWRRAEGHHEVGMAEAA